MVLQRARKLVHLSVVLSKHLPTGAHASQQDLRACSCWLTARRAAQAKRRAFFPARKTRFLNAPRAANGSSVQGWSRCNSCNALENRGLLRDLPTYNGVHVRSLRWLVNLEPHWDMIVGQVA